MHHLQLGSLCRQAQCLHLIQWGQPAHGRGGDWGGFQVPSNLQHSVVPWLLEMNKTVLPYQHLFHRCVWGSTQAWCYLKVGECSIETLKMVVVVGKSDL